MRWYVAGCLLMVGMARAQEPVLDGAGQSGISTLRAKTTLVLVPALVVTTKDNKPVFTLTAEDFALTDDGVPQKLRLEEAADRQPLALVVMVESGGDGIRHLDDFKALEPMIEAVIGGVEHTVAVVDFDSEPEVLQPFTGDLDKVGNALRSMEAGDDGAVVLDALSFSVDLLRKQPARYRRAILMFTETHDRQSKVSVEDAVRVVGDTNTAIYSFGFSSTRAEAKRAGGALPPQLGGNDDPGPAGGCMSRKPDADGNPPRKSLGEQAYDCASLLLPPLALAKMAFVAAVGAMRQNVPEAVAKQTGGEYFAFKDFKGLERGLQTLGNHVPNRYMLSFTPQAPHQGIHALALTVQDRPSVRVEARTSYWAEAADK